MELHLLRKGIAACLLIAAATVAVPRAGHAQGEAVKSAHEGVIESAKKLRREGDALISRDDVEAQTLAAKRETLEKVLNLTTLEAQAAQAKVRAISDSDIETEATFALLKGRVSEALGEHLKALEAWRLALAERVTGEGIALFANDLNVWRRDWYNPTVQEALEFVLVVNNRAAVKLGNSRFAKFAAYARRVKAQTGKPVEWDPLLRQALGSLQGAERAYEDAKAKLVLYLPQPAGDEGAGDTIPEVQPIPPPVRVEGAAGEHVSISQRVAASLDDLKRTYGIFIRIAKLLQGEGAR